MTATVSGATSCTLTTKPLLMGYPKTIKPCTSFTKSVKLPANTTATPKFYTLKLSATGGGSTVKAATMAVVLGKAPPASSITVSGALTKNTLLSPGLASVYLFSGQVSIPSGLTLTVAPGTIVKFENCGGCYLDVQGALRAVGTSTSPITFTSIDDNSVGGATGSGSPTTFDWGGISVGNSPGTPVSSIDLEQSTVEWTGSTYGKAVYVGDHSIGTVSSNQFINLDPLALGVQALSAIALTNNATDGNGYYLSSNNLNLSKVSGNTAPSGKVVAITGTVTASSTLTSSATPVEIDNCLEVPAGVTLTVAAGTVMKPNGWCGNGYTLDVAGTLNAVGTSGSPISFTSLNDNSIGGPTGTGSPNSSDWGGIQTLPGGSIDLEHANVSYTGYANGVAAVYAGGASATILNDTFDTIFPGRYPVAAHAGTVNVSNNEFTNTDSGSWSVYADTPITLTNNTTDGGYGYYLTSDHLNVNNVSGNTGPSGAVVSVTGTVTTSSTLTTSTIPWEINNCLEVPAGVTLTVQAGTVVKSTGWCGSGFAFDVSGTLNAVGTSDSPITFTSVNDDSIGGATGTGSPGSSDWGGIETLSGASIDLEHANVSYAGYANGVAAVYAGGASATILNDTFDTIFPGRYAVAAHAGTVNVSNNEFTHTDSQSWTVYADTPITLTNNTTDGGRGYYLTSTDLNLNNVSGNTGPSGAVVSITGTVTTSSTLTASTTPWEIDTCLTVPTGVTLSVDAGTVIKSTGWCGDGYTLDVAGTLNAIGTAISPITFTSINDNSIGGATGSGSPAVGDWGGIGQESGGLVNCVFCDIKYASN